LAPAVTGAAAGLAATLAAGAGAPPAGSVGSLIVGDAEGFGGSVMRTVSFFGCTLAASAGFGGTEPPDGLEVSSAINRLRNAKYEM
jgi:hypothetical protein